MDVSIITLNYKKKDLTASCLHSLYTQFEHEFKDGTIECIVVDNASGDGSVDYLKNQIRESSYKNIFVVANDKNAGFGAGCNLGAKHAKGKYLLFLNNDTIVTDKSILSMSEYLDKNPKASIIGGQLVNPDGSLQSSSGVYFTLKNVIALLFAQRFFRQSEKETHAIHMVDWVKGACLMIRKSVFEKLNGFDEKIFMYTEDMELCYRAHLSGYEIYFYPKARVTHIEHGSGNRSFAIEHIFKNLPYFYKKHRSPIEYMILIVLLHIKADTSIFIGILSGNTYLQETYKKAKSQI